MRAYDIIFKKRNRESLNKEEINFFVESFTKGEIPNYQASAFLMAAFICGLDSKETTLLTEAMSSSGEKLDLSSVPGVKVDKHSTGGVGDGISLVVAPLVSACGVPVPMISGRGLGHTGGTLDKLESIPGFRVNLSKEEFIQQLKKIGIAMIGQTEDLAPVDKKFYALRDVTATIDSIPLIAASIFSKKLAEGSDALVLDIKTGCGAFMQEKKDAIQLAKVMTAMGKKFGKKTVSLITDMSQPLGPAIGNSLEVEQAIEILSGKEDPRTKSFIELTEILGGWMLFLGKVCKSFKEGKEKIRQAILNRTGLKKFKEMVEMQGGDVRVCEDPKSVLPHPKVVKEISSPWKGIIRSMNARAIGKAALLLGAGREKQEDTIDYSAAILLHKKVGDRVERGETMAEFYFSDPLRLDEAEKIFLSAVKIGKVHPRLFPLVYEVIQ